MASCTGVCVDCVAKIRISRSDPALDVLVNLGLLSTDQLFRPCRCRMLGISAMARLEMKISLMSFRISWISCASPNCR